jgi:hypothetical protein
MKKKAVVISAVLLLAIVVAAIFVTNGYLTAAESKKDPFHVGVTFGGDNAADAKQLIDKVKGYTNLFVITSGSLQNNAEALQEIGDYAVDSGLDVIVSFGTYEGQRQRTANFSEIAHQRWGSHFLGVYYGDEPSGKSLEGNMRLDNVPNLGNINVGQYVVGISQKNGSVMTSKTFYYAPPFEGQINVASFDPLRGKDSSIKYFPNGTITLLTNRGETSQENMEYLFYLPNGTVLKQETIPTDDNQFVVTDGNETSNQHIIWPKVKYSEVTNRGNINQFEPYQQLWDSRPFQTMDALSKIAHSYVETQKQTITNWIKTHSNTTLFTADYVLPWWDYQIGYDTVFAELGWNNTVNQEIGLVRGAANLQGKDWGTIITWKYMQSPYLCSGNEMYDQMRASYEAGAKYVVVFNYAETMTGPYGILQDEHFEALQRFWNDVVQSPWVAHGGVKAEAALVLPADYGWGMRNMNDSIWGIWKPDNTTQQIWNLLQDKLGQYGSKLDIVYEDPAYPVAGKYSQVIYWNQTS